MFSKFGFVFHSDVLFFVCFKLFSFLWRLNLTNILFLVSFTLLPFKLGLHYATSNGYSKQHVCLFGVCCVATTHVALNSSKQVQISLIIFLVVVVCKFKTFKASSLEIVSFRKLPTSTKLKFVCVCVSFPEELVSILKTFLTRGALKVLFTNSFSTFLKNLARFHPLLCLFQVNTV